MRALLSKYRIKSGFHKLKQEIKKISRKNKSISLKAAQYIGIVVTVENQKQLDEIEKVALEFQKQNKKVRLLAFTSNINLKTLFPSNIELITKEDINWNFVPKREKIINFVNNEFDILINLCTEICFPLVYITALSKSFFKVGAYHKKHSAFYDFMLATQQQSISGFNTELKYYLDKIK
ncbi:DUF6913 domain-containing protein [Pedobacter arcticus]|uniref:DUF6913 domain-containing protein n=1 Tax=Pedobacter arcticus TaxID=752140 RepID=UPI0003116030|nr:hypothetical protein [Pedobacter arcticus]